MPWTDNLTRPLKPCDHNPLRTLADVRAYVLDLPSRLAAHRAWQHAGELLIEAADNPTRASIEDATRQIELALFVTGLMEMTPTT